MRPVSGLFLRRLWKGVSCPPASGDSLSRLRYDAGGCFSDHRRSFRQPKGKSVPSSSDRLAPHLYLGALLEKPARPSFFRLYRRSDSFYGTLLSLSDGCIFSQ